MKDLRETGVVAVLRLRDHGLAVEVCDALVRGGIRVLELTQDDPGALAALRAVASSLDGAVVGAGTVVDAATIPSLADAGARFVVAPNTDPRVIAASLEAGLTPLPGALTATEVATAVAAGASLVKLFPAGPLGPAYLRALRGPFERVSFVPTGGIAHDAVGAWIAAGAVAVGLGADLVGARPTDADLAGIEQRARLAVAGARA
jgi:Entner-Doudoroff aldolase